MEVIREALNLFEPYEDVKTAKLDSLRQDIAQGLSDAQNGCIKEIDFASLKQQGRLHSTGQLRNSFLRW